MSIFEKLFTEIHSVDAGEVPPEIADGGLLAGQAFEGMLMSLRVDKPVEGFSFKIVKSPLIKDACDLLFQLVGSKITPVAATNAVDSLHFFAESKDKEFTQARAFILVPVQFAQMSVMFPPLHMGGIVYIASKAKDYWNKKINKDTDKRAISMEAEFLKTLFKDHPQLVESGVYPTPYQRKVLEKYPDGIESALDVHYKTRPFDENAGPPFRVKVEDMVTKKHE